MEVDKPILKFIRFSFKIGTDYSIGVFFEVLGFLKCFQVDKYFNI